MPLWTTREDSRERVLVTGAAGLLGTAVIADLLASGYAVHAIDRRPPGEPWPEDDVWFVQTDLDDAGHVASVMRRCNAVIHLAAIAHPHDQPDEVVFANNTQATFAVLQAAAITGVRRVAIASSESIYGTAWSPELILPRWVPIGEDHPLDIRDAYALSKQVDEATAAMVARRDGISIAALRFAWILTRERQLARVNEGRDEFTRKEARLVWSYVDLRDAARACRLAIEAARESFGFRAFNIVAADTTIHTPTEEALRRSAPEIAIRERLEGCAGGFDIRAAREELGWMPEHSWRDDV